MTQMLQGLNVEASCPACGYSLRGLTEMRCPECGRPFEWLDLLVPGSKYHPYLFEHHPRRNAWSFWRTVSGGLRPRRFWAPLHPAQPHAPGRLLAYWMAVMAVALLGAVAPYAVERRGTLFTPTLEPNCLAWWAWGFAWPWLTGAALICLRRLTGRSKWNAAFVTPASLVRCALYSGDVLIWAGVGLLLFSAIRGVECWGWVRLPGSWWPPDWTLALMLLGFAGWCVYKLAVGLEVYLRIERPWLWAIASQVMVVAVGLIASVLVWIALH